MNIPFYKYQGTGNDFIIIDQWNEVRIDSSTSKKQIEQMCNRRFGVGADGLILLEQHPEYDFKMIYYNADGAESSMCGNGGRCIVALAHKLGYIKDECSFEAIDGLHLAKVIGEGEVSLKMSDVSGISEDGEAIVLDTGSPHYVTYTTEVDAIDVQKRGAAIRYSERYQKSGINVNFVQDISDQTIKVRTYERGVEAETYSCGTGVTAAAIATHHAGITDSQVLKIQTLGGKLQVSFSPLSDDSYENIWLTGPATLVFEGSYAC